MLKKKNNKKFEALYKRLSIKSFFKMQTVGSLLRGKPVNKIEYFIRFIKKIFQHNINMSNHSYEFFDIIIVGDDYILNTIIATYFSKKGYRILIIHNAMIGFSFDYMIESQKRKSLITEESSKIISKFLDISLKEELDHETTEKIYFINGCYHSDILKNKNRYIVQLYKNKENKDHNVFYPFNEIELKESNKESKLFGLRVDETNDMTVESKNLFVSSLFQGYNLERLIEIEANLVGEGLDPKKTNRIMKSDRNIDIMGSIRAIKRIENE